MKIIIRNYFSNIEIGLDLDAESVRRIKRGRCIKEIIEFVDDEITMVEVDEFGNVIERYDIDDMPGTSSITIA